MTILIGNIIAMFATILMLYSSTLKVKKKIILIQTIQIFLLAISSLVLGGISGAVVNFICCVRNILCYKDALRMKEKIILIIISIVFPILFNNMGIIGLLPIIGSIVYILYMNTNNIIHFKILIIFVSFTWLVYEIFINSYIALTFDFVNILINAYSIFIISTKKKR